MSARIESGFVPLPKVEQEQPEDKIKIILNLPPYVDQDRIGVNLTGISKLCRLGGIRQLVVIGKTDEETSHVIPEISGMNSDGSAIASKKIARVTVPTFQVNPHSLVPDRNQRIEARWVDLRVNMNIDEICLRVSEKSEGVHSPKNWARELNKGFKTPIRRAGNQNLLHNLEHGDKADYAWLSVLVAAYPGLPLLVGQFNPEGAAFNLLWYYGCARAGALIRRVFNPDQNQRFSMIPGLQVDRAIVLGIESRVKTLIKDLHSDKK